VRLEELASLLADTVELVREVVPSAFRRKRYFLDDPRLDELLEVLPDRRSALARIHVVQFLQRRQSLGMTEEVLHEGEPRLLGDDVQPLANVLEVGRRSIRRAHTRRFGRCVQKRFAQM